MYPAAFDNVLSVGAKNGDTIANYSNGGENADCFANGSQSTTDINGNTVNIIGTSGATAFVAGTILKNWCVIPEKTSLDIIADIKTEMSLTAGVDTSETLTLTNENGILINEKDDIALNVTELNARSLDEGVSVLCVGDDGDDGCSSNDMSSAISVPFFSWQSACITCPGNEVWYKFTTNIDEAHANGSKGWYGVQTQGSLDTVGYLYDAYGNQIDYDDDSGKDMNFKISKQLEYGETYYVKVRAFGSNTGSFSFKVDYGRDDHGNSMDTATEIVGVYYQDKSVNGYLHSYGDVDFYTFVPARNCVMEIYTEGDTNTYGQLYCASGGLLDSDNNSNGNGNFKITAHLEAMKRYYIAVSHNSSTGYGDYTLRFKFVRDYSNQILDEQYRVMYWYADNQDEYPDWGHFITRSKVFVSNKAKHEFEIRVLMDRYGKKQGLANVLGDGTLQEIYNFLLDKLISSIPIIGEMISAAYDVGTMIYGYMTVTSLEEYQSKTIEIENQNQYIIGKHYWYEDYPHTDPIYDPDTTGAYTDYSVGSGVYYGEYYQRGKFIETIL